MTRFEDFKRDCLSNGEIICNWNTLHEYLIDKTVADNWWELTKEERVSICDACCQHWGDAWIEKIGYDSDGDGIPDKEETWTPCIRQAEIRYLIFNQKEYRQSTDYGNFSNCYYYIRDDGWHNYEEEGYELPCHVVRGAFPSGLHELNAIQIGKDESKIYNWYIFDCDHCNIKPGHPLFDFYFGDGTSSICILLEDKFLEQYYSNHCVIRCKRKEDGATYYCIAEFENIQEDDWIEEDTHDTTLSIDIINANGNQITEARVGDTVYVVGTLRDAETGELLQNAEIHLYKDGTNTGLSDKTDERGEYSIPYTVVSADYPSVTFKTRFEGAEGK